MRRTWIFLILIIPLAILGVAASGFPYPRTSLYSDISISHYPNLIYIREWLSQGVLPLWSDAILSGYPFAADPLSGLWYPPGWLLWVLPLPAGINYMVLLHLFWSGIGMFQFLRQRGMKDYSSLIGAIGFELMPKLIGHYAAGHMTLVFAVSWTPWLLWAESRSHQNKIGFSSLPGIVLGLIALADIRWTVYAAGLWLSFGIYELWIRGWKIHQHDYHNNIRKFLFKEIGYFFLQGILALLIAAPIILPMLEFTRLATRSHMTLADNLTQKLPPQYLAGLLIPDLGGYAEWILYPGVLLLVLAIWGSLRTKHRKAVAFWGIVSIFSLSYALGITGFLSTFPGLNLLRVPTRILFIFGFSICVLAAIGFEVPKKEMITRKKMNFDGDSILVGIILFVVLTATGIWILTYTFPIEFGWSAASLSLFGILFLLKRNAIISDRFWRMVLIPLLVLDLGGVAISQIRFRSFSEVTGEGAAAAAYISSENKDRSRTYSPSYSIGQQTAALYRLEIADGIDPMQLKSYSDYMRIATNVISPDYSVTIPAFKNGNPVEDNRDAMPDLKMLGVLNVKYLVSAYDIKGMEKQLVTRLEDVRIYENPLTKPRAWTQSFEGHDLVESLNEVKWISRTPNDLEMEAVGPGILVLSEIYYPGWQAKVDGIPVEIIPKEGLLRSISLSSGTHHIKMIFQPISLYVGLGLASLTWLFLVFRRTLLK
jgi:hypothetical protein